MQREKEEDYNLEKQFLEVLVSEVTPDHLQREKKEDYNLEKQFAQLLVLVLVLVFVQPSHISVLNHC